VVECKRYTIVDEWGGGQVEATEPHRDWPTPPPGWVLVTRPGSGWVAFVAESALEELPPPIPEEPKPGAYLIGQAGIWERWDSWDRTPERGIEREHWRTIGTEVAYSWTEVWGEVGPDVSIVPLIPDPAVGYDNAELPWEPGEIRVRLTSNGVIVAEEWGGLGEWQRIDSRAEVLKGAAALLAAAGGEGT